MVIDTLFFFFISFISFLSFIGYGKITNRVVFKSKINEKNQFNYFFLVY